MGAIISLESGALPAYLQNKEAFKELNADVLNGGINYPYLSIKGKVFTAVKNKEKKLLTIKVDGEDIARPSLVVGVIRANTKSRQYYASGYSESTSEGQPPDCYSMDGVAPSVHAKKKQCAKCALCPQAAWGSRVARPGEEGGEGTACSPRTRLAIFDPEAEELTPMLLNVPVASRKGYTEEVAKFAENRSIPYNALAVKLSFDNSVAGVKLLFKPAGLMSDAQYAKIMELYDSPEVKEILGLTETAPPAAEPPAPAATQPAVTSQELDKILGKVAAPAPAPAPAPAAPVVVESAQGLMSSLDALLSKKDD